MRFLLLGKFKLDVYGKDEKIYELFDLICFYMIYCMVLKKDCFFLFDQLVIGWGLVQEMKDLGVVLISYNSVVIVIEDGKIDIKLGINKKMEIYQFLKSIILDEVIFSKYIFVCEENGEYFIYIRFL